MDMETIVIALQGSLFLSALVLVILVDRTSNRNIEGKFSRRSDFIGRDPYPVTKAVVRNIILILLVLIPLMNLIILIKIARIKD